MRTTRKGIRYLLLSRHFLIGDEFIDASARTSSVPQVVLVTISQVVTPAPVSVAEFT
ncbi:MAG: hypothetical protein ACLP36_02380 [Acidimicrobiales bacterium]